MRRLVSRALILATLGGPLGLPGATAQSPLARLAARPSALRLRVGETASLVVTAYDAAGDAVEVPIRVTGPRRAMRIRQGTLEALTAGSYDVVASAAAPGGTLTLTVPVTIEWPAVETITVTSQDEALYEGTATTVAAVVSHRDGTVRPAAQVQWSSSDSNVAVVDRFGQVTGVGTGRVTVAAGFEGAAGTIDFDVAAFPAATLEMHGGLPQIRTGDVQQFEAVARDREGDAIEGIPVVWSMRYAAADGLSAPAAPGQLLAGKFVADQPGIYTVIATAGPLRAQQSFEVVPRHVVQRVDVVGHGRQDRIRTTDFWVFEGVDGRDYAITGSKRADGHAYVFDVTDPGNIIKTDSVQVDARAVNDVKVSPDARYATVTREGASNRRNGLVILDLKDPAHPTIASSFDDGLTGGVHNAFPTNDYVFALSGGDKYVIIDVRDIYAPRYVSEYDHPNSRVHDVWVDDGLAYSAEWETGLVVVDVGNGKWGGTIEHPVFVTSYPLPTGATHAVFPYVQASTGKHYVFVGDEIMTREGLALGGGGGADYQVPYDPATGRGGIPLSTQGYVQVIDFTDPEHPEMVARYEVSEYGTHNIWVENDVLYQAYYEGGLRVVDVSGELMGNLYTQGREIAAFKSADPLGYVPNSPMVWSAMPFKGHVFFTDTNSGLWAVRLQPLDRPVM
jgi:hypothetical protein